MLAITRSILIFLCFCSELSYGQAFVQADLLNIEGRRVAQRAGSAPQNVALQWIEPDSEFGPGTSSTFASISLENGRIPRTTVEVNGSGTAMVHGESRDVVRFSSPVVSSGSILTVHGEFSILGSSAIPKEGEAPFTYFLHYDLQTAGPSGLAASESTIWFSRGPRSFISFFDTVLTPPETKFGTFEIAFPVVSGEETVFSWFYDLNISRGFPDNSAVSLDILDAFRWNGIRRVTIGGEDVPYSVTSSSGFNWAVAAVPEAGTYALMLAGLGIVGVAARRHKHGRGER